MDNYTDAEIGAFIDGMAEEAHNLYAKYWDTEASRLYKLAVGDDVARGVQLQAHILRLLGDINKARLQALSFEEYALVKYIMDKDAETAQGYVLYE